MLSSLIGPAKDCVILSQTRRCFRHITHLAKNTRLNRTKRQCRSFQSEPAKEKGMVIYDEANSNKKILRYGRLGIGMQLVALIAGAEAIHAVRTKDEFESEVNPNIQVNLYTGKAGFILVPAALGLAVAFTAAGYFAFGRIVKKVLFTPSSGRITMITHHLFGGENVAATTLGGVQTQHNYSKVEGYSWRFLLSDEADIPNKQMFNHVMGVGYDEIS